jgi:hypothetical protein
MASRNLDGQLSSSAMKQNHEWGVGVLQLRVMFSLSRHRDVKLADMRLHRNLAGLASVRIKGGFACDDVRLRRSARRHDHKPTNSFTIPTTRCLAMW